MPDYKNGKIYKLVCDATNKIYVGSTTEKYLSTRLAKHKYDFKNREKQNKNLSSCEIFNNDNYRIELIECYECNNKYELEKRERYWIENLDCVNLIKPTKTRDEYLKLNYKNIQEYQKKKIKCDNCDKFISRGCIHRHKKTIYCLNFG